MWQSLTFKSVQPHVDMCHDPTTQNSANEMAPRHHLPSLAQTRNPSLTLHHGSHHGSRQQSPLFSTTFFTLPTTNLAVATTVSSSSRTCITINESQQIRVQRAASSLPENCATLAPATAPWSHHGPPLNDAPFASTPDRSSSHVAGEEEGITILAYVRASNSPSTRGQRLFGF